MILVTTKEEVERKVQLETLFISNFNIQWENAEQNFAF